MNRLSQMAKSFRLRKYIFRIGIAMLLLAAVAVTRSCLSTQTNMNNSYRILRNTSWYPSQLPGTGTRFFAFTGELIRKAFQPYGFDIELADINSENSIESLENSAADAIIGPLIPNSVTRRSYYFSNPFYKTGPVLVVAQDSPLASLDGLDEKVIGIKRDSPILFDLAAYDLFFSPYDSMSEAFGDLIAQKIDGIIVPVVEANAFIDAFYPGKFKIITAPLSNEGVRIAARRTPKGKLLIDAFNVELKKMQLDGSYNKLLEKWNL